VYYTIVQSLEDLFKSRDSGISYTFCEINPISLYGIPLSCAPMVNHNPGGRSIHEANMSMTSQTAGSTNMNSLSEASSKVLLTTEKACVSTIHNEYWTRHYGNGINALMLVRLTETNIEDAMSVGDNFAKTVITKRSNTIEVEVPQGVKLGIPPVEGINRHKYHAIHSESHLPIIDAEVKPGDCIFAMYKISETKEPTDDPEIANLSIFIEKGKEGFISKFKAFQLGKNIVYRITVSFYMVLVPGDKIATRYSQKGVIGAIIPSNKLPFVISGKNKGLRPDIIFSPLSLTSRSTPGLIHELHLGNYAITFGETVNASAFTVNINRLDQISEKLREAGFPTDMYETFYDPISKETFKAYMGFCYVRILSHTSYEKEKACSQIVGSINKLTRQPARGGPTGALQEGNMELCAYASHSSPDLINAFYSQQSDKINVVLCGDCGFLNDGASDETIKCLRCSSMNLHQTETVYSTVRARNQLLTAGIDLSLFPKKLY
jgi:DNA-directed RNA polymerase beta subunit